MSVVELTEVIRRPLLSEKSTRIADKNRQIAFEVAVTATKARVKRAVEELFNVKVAAVHILNVKPKRKVFRQRIGVRKAIKKAYVTLQEGHDIAFSS